MDLPRDHTVRKKLDQAKFVVSPDTRCDVFVVKGQNFRGSNHKTSVQNIFAAQELIIDAVTYSFRPKLSINPWTRRLPRDVMRYCYQCVPYGRMSFALRLEDDPRIDYMVFVIDDKDVRMPVFYKELYDTEMETRRTPD